MERLPMERLLLSSDDGDDGLQQELNGYVLMVDTIAFSTKAYWAMWGPLGQPMIDGIDRWARSVKGLVSPDTEERAQRG